jgi:hypothetical protein
MVAGVGNACERLDAFIVEPAPVAEFTVVHGPARARQREEYESERDAQCRHDREATLSLTSM